MLSEHRLLVLYTGVNFHENIWNGTRVMEQTRNYEELKDRRTLKISDGITEYLAT